jgi:hypothetical protein
VAVLAGYSSPTLGRIGPLSECVDERVATGSWKGQLMTISASLGPAEAIVAGHRVRGLARPDRSRPNDTLTPEMADHTSDPLKGQQRIPRWVRLPAAVAPDRTPVN